MCAVHGQLDRIFALFRELVLVGDRGRAALVVAALRDLTASHAADEEAALVPLLDDTARWPAELYLGQHTKLLAGIDRLSASLDEIGPRRAGWRTAALAVLDLAAPMMHLAEHHHLAEEQDLFVIAAARAPHRLDELAARWQEERARHQVVLDEATAALDDLGDAAG